jgi:hypothetical protein
VNITMDAKTARAHAAALNVAFTDYLEALRSLNRIEQCDNPWPPSLHDVAPARCQLLAGHQWRDGTQHSHRIRGSQAIVEWDS